MTRQNSMPCLDGLNAAVANEDDAADIATPAAKLPTATGVRPALIPLWDMANHINGTVTNVYNVAEQRVEGGALLDFQKGDQIFIYYGDRRNSNFLVHNGYGTTQLCT